jgi:hypothetical protein
MIRVQGGLTDSSLYFESLAIMYVCVLIMDHASAGRYASKDFFDPVKKRRINWGWARVPPASTQTLPREVTWHPQLQQLVFSPLEEQAALRTTPALTSISGPLTLAAGQPKSLGVRRPLRPAACRFDWDFPVRRVFLSRNIEGATDAGGRRGPAPSATRVR